MKKFETFDHSVSIITVERQGKKYAMTCAWATQVGYEHLVCLIGSQSLTGRNIQKGDVIGISVLTKKQVELANRIGETHSNEVDKFKDTFNYEGVNCYRNARRVLKCLVEDVLHLKDIEEDNLVFAKIIDEKELNNDEILHMSDM